MSIIINSTCHTDPYQDYAQSSLFPINLNNKTCIKNV